MTAMLQLHPDTQRLRQDYAIAKVSSALDTAAEAKRHLAARPSMQVSATGLVEVAGLAPAELRQALDERAQHEAAEADAKGRDPPTHWRTEQLFTFPGESVFLVSWRNETTEAWWRAAEQDREEAPWPLVLLIKRRARRVEASWEEAEACLAWASELPGWADWRTDVGPVYVRHPVPPV